jgi:hypothetical protein
VASFQAAKERGSDSIMRRKYLFFADADLRVFISELVAQQYSQDGEHHFFSYHPRTQETWDLYPWASRTYLPWIHREGRSWIEKNIGLRKRIGHILQTVGDVCEGADEVILHSYEFYSERINYLFNYLRDRYPGMTVRGRLIPDGSLNITRRPMYGVRSLAPLVNRMKWLFDRELRYYCYYGDRLGAEADLVDRIYLPEGFPHEYAPEKVFWLKMPRADTPARVSREEPTALVVGTALTQTGVCSRADMRIAAQSIARFLNETGVKRVLYKPHHKESPDFLELWSDGYELLHTKKCVERLILEHSYDHLVAMCSSSLLNAKLMFKRLSVTSCALDLLEKRLRRNAAEKTKYRPACESLGIQLIPAFADARGASGRRAGAA